MKLVKTVKFKIVADAADLLPTVINYTNSYNHICKIGYKQKIFNPIELHNITYKEVRAKFSLPSQLTISARSKAAENLKALRKKKYAKCPSSKLQSIRYDKNSYSLFLKENQVSLSTCSGRKRYNLIVSNYHKEFFKSWKYTSADLKIVKNKVYLHIVFEKEIENTAPNGEFIGLDRGISNLAVLSNNSFFSGKKTKHVSQRYRNLRKRLQKKGTKSAKRHLQKISGKEKRFKADINHQISKQIIDSLNPGDILVLEDLKGIRAQRLRKTIRTLIHNWSFYQLEQFLEYKANAKGISIMKVSARYTSQICSECGFCSRNNRKTQANFVCQSCGFKLNADLNASRNLALRAQGKTSKESLDGYKLSNEDVINHPNV